MATELSAFWARLTGLRQSFSAGTAGWALRCSTRQRCQPHAQAAGSGNGAPTAGATGLVVPGRTEPALPTPGPAAAPVQAPTFPPECAPPQTTYQKVFGPASTPSSKQDCKA